MGKLIPNPETVNHFLLYLILGLGTGTVHIQKNVTSKIGQYQGMVGEYDRTC